MIYKAAITTFILNWIVTNGGTPVQDGNTFSDAGLDSLDLIELTLDVEERFEVSLDRVDMELDMTVARLVSEIEVRK